MDYTSTPAYWAVTDIGVFCFTDKKEKSVGPILKKAVKQDIKLTHVLKPHCLLVLHIVNYVRTTRTVFPARRPTLNKIKTG